MTLVNTLGLLCDFLSMQIFDLTVNRPRAINHTNARHETEAPARIYNDVHFRPRNQVICDSWALFPQLLPELRLHIWQVFLQQHRMIELGIRADGDENGPQSHYYTDRNHLGNIVSGRNYSLTISGRGYTASLSPLLRVSSEARQAALDFYRVQLPFPLRDGERVLYLNPEYDVLYVRPEFRSPNMPPTDVQPKPRAASVLVDFLHDARAYDPKDKGFVLFQSCSLTLTLSFGPTSFLFDHPQASLSFPLYEMLLTFAFPFIPLYKPKPSF